MWCNNERFAHVEIRDTAGFTGVPCTLVLCLSDFHLARNIIKWLKLGVQQLPPSISITLSAFQLLFQLSASLRRVWSNLRRLWSSNTTSVRTAQMKINEYLRPKPLLVFLLWLFEIFDPTMLQMASLPYNSSYPPTNSSKMSRYKIRFKLSNRTLFMQCSPNWCLFYLICISSLYHKRWFIYVILAISLTPFAAQMPNSWQNAGKYDVDSTVSCRWDSPD